RQATSFEDFHEGDVRFKGKTVANAQLTIQKASLTRARAVQSLSAQADDQGNFSFDLSSWDLHNQDQVTITVTDQAGYQVAFTQTVLAANAPTPDTSTSSSSLPSDTSKNKDETTKSTTDQTAEKSKGESNDLPATGVE